MNDIEQQFQEQPLRPLPQEWKEAILDEAWTSGAPNQAPRRRSFVELLFMLVPKPVAIPLAAAWVLITALWISTPSGQRSSIAGLMADSSRPTSTGPREEAQKIRTMIWVAFHEDLEPFADIDGESDAPESGAFPSDSSVLP